MKYYIYGSVGSGKTTYADSLGKMQGIPYYSLDNIIYQRIDGQEYKRSIREQEEVLKEITQQSHWIIEGAQLRIHFLEIFLKHDVEVYILDIPYHTVLTRIVRRWFRQRKGIEESHYTPDIKMLKKMLWWSLHFQMNKNKSLTVLQKYTNNITRIKK